MAARALGASSPPTLSSTLARSRSLADRPSRAQTTTSNPIKAKWKSFVNFFALPIRQYYLEPPGVTYRARNEVGVDAVHQWPCPTYTGEVGDDEMILFRTQELDRDVQRQDALQERSDPIGIRRVTSSQEHDSDEAQSPAMPQTPPNASGSAGFQALSSADLYGEPSPRYEILDPIAELDRVPLSARRPVSPGFQRGTAITRHSSTPLVPTAGSSPSRPSFLYRRSRASSNSALSSPSIAGRPISEPLTNTLVRSQYSYPKRGLTAQQLSFLSSVESLGRFGVSGSVQSASMTPVLLDSPAYDDSGPDYGFPSAP